MESKETKVDLNPKASAPKWLLWIGLATSLIGLFVPGQFCMDSCSFSAPNFLVLTVGLVLLGVSCVAFAKAKSANRVALIVGVVFAFLLALNAGTMAINGWFSLFLVFAEIAALPFVLVGIIVWAIVRGVAKRRKANAAADSADPAAPSGD